MSKVKILLTIAALLLGALNSVSWAQSSKGVIVGTIADRSGSVINSAKIKVINTATNVTRETVSMGEGSFRFDAVDPGTYRVEAAITSSWTVARDGVLVAAGQTTEVTFKLILGTLRDLVNVPADSTVILQTQDGARTSTITGREITDLPLGSRNPSDLVFTLPGVVTPGLGGGFVQGSEFSTNGLRGRANSQLIDGTENNDISIAGQAYIPTLREGFQEVSVLGGNNSAEYGRGGGAVINLITRSAGNKYHGSVYDIIAPSALFSLSSGQRRNPAVNSVPVTIQNQYGFSFGGPIKKDQLFFFGTFQASPFRTSGSPTTAVVPTQAGFAQLRALFPAGQSPNLDRYLSIVGNLRAADPGVNVPLGGGRPAIPFGLATATNVSQRVDDYQWLARVDWTPTTKDSFTFRQLFDDNQTMNAVPSAFDGFGVDFAFRSQNSHFSYTRNLSPRWTNEFRFAYGRFVALVQPNNPSIALSGPVFSFAGTAISPVGLDAAYPQGRYLNNFQFQDTITYTRGDHTVRAGMDLVRQTTKEVVPFNNRGILTFSAGGDFLAFGNFVDGFSGTQGTFGNKVFGTPVVYPDRFQQAYFVDDSWRVRSNLSLKLGLRYESFGTPSNVLAYPAFPGFNVPITTRVEQQADNNNFAPRVSFAYTPRWGGKWFGADKTVIRGGYQLSYDVFFDNILTGTGASSPNALGTNTTGTPLGGRGIPNAGVNSLPSTGTLNPMASILTIDPNLVNPLAHTWNLGVQRELPSNLLVDVAYVGSRGSRLFLPVELNSGINFVRPIAGRGNVLMRANAGDSIYHSLQARVERGLSKGKLFRFAYTYSKAIDNVNSEIFTTSGGTNRSSDPLNLGTDRSVASFDAPHRLVWSFIWDVPGPKTGLLSQALGGWSLSGIYNLQSGAVESPYVGGFDLNGDLNALNDRPSINNLDAPANSVAIANSTGLCGVPATMPGYCDVSQNQIQLANARYLVDPAVRSKIAGRNSLRANWTNRVDAGLAKVFGLPFEGQRLEVRVEFFNLFNHPNYTWSRFDQSNGNVFSPNFNNVGLNDGGISILPNTAQGLQAGRAGRFLVRYSF